MNFRIKNIINDGKEDERECSEVIRIDKRDNRMNTVLTTRT